ncbi:MAG: flagellar biosynthesis protein FlgJ [Tissierellia bacterium]|nr:flagellar biosynthesis protein FlgJ [Tissierellia bacterium]
MEINLDLYNNPVVLKKKAESLKADKEDEALKKVCKEFESIFLAMMFKEMKKTVPEGGLIEKSTGQKIFEEMYIDEISKEITKENGLGIAEMLYQQFKNGYVPL